ncbi:hypothetical protein D1007_29982 [Hordeum vulgare]|nr:hypothetical protein D1007_29982 [Hordeum vulgare]
MTLHPLDHLDDNELYTGNRKRLDALSHILVTHTARVRCLAINKFDSNCKVDPKFHEWFLFPTLDQLEELNSTARHGRSLLPSVLYLVPTLWRATFREYLFPRLMPRTLFISLN